MVDLDRAGAEILTTTDRSVAGDCGGLVRSGVTRPSRGYTAEHGECDLLSLRRASNLADALLEGVDVTLALIEIRVNGFRLKVDIVIGLVLNHQSEGGNVGGCLKPKCRVHREYRLIGFPSNRADSLVVNNRGELVGCRRVRGQLRRAAGHQHEHR